MAETSEIAVTDRVTAQELTEVIAELEQYRERLVDDTLETARRVKMLKPKALAQLEPELTRIDAMLQALHEQQVVLTTSN